MPSPDPSPTNHHMRRAGESTLLWTVWFTYGAFYFCRTNLSVALPGIEEELGYTKTRMAVVLLSLKLAYAFGQFVNGQLSERFSPRKMLAIGMFASAALNVVFGFSTGLYFFLFIWACNGYCQSLGWTPCVRVLGNWIPVHRRGKAIGLVGTGYQLTAGLTYLVSGLGVWWFGWRGALFLPPVILVSAALLMLLLLKETPDGTSSREQASKQRDDGGGGFLKNLRLTLANPALWLLALSLGMLNASRYGFLDWGVSHLVSIEKAKLYELDIEDSLRSDQTTPEQKQQLQEILDADLASKDGEKLVKQAISDGIVAETSRANSRGAVLKSAIKYAVLPIGGIFGSFLAGWATDRFFGSRRAPVICVLLLSLGAMSLIYGPVANTSFAATVVLLTLIGFCIYGPQVLLVGTAPADLARQGTSAAAAGFVNCMGYVGAALLGDVLTGYLADKYGWQVAIYGWAGCAFGAAIAAGLLWTAKPPDSKPKEATS
jgi:sugar phosphate permease